jgi:malate synthase
MCYQTDSNIPFETAPPREQDQLVCQGSRFPCAIVTVDRTGATERPMATIPLSENAISARTKNHVGAFQINTPPADFNRERDLPEGFLEFLIPLHRKFSPWRTELGNERKAVLHESHAGTKPVHRYPGPAVRNGWYIELPEWCQDQRNQMTGPADDAELVVKMLNSGAPGVMLDLEDSTVNQWQHQQLGAENILAALRGTLTYADKKRDRVVGIQPSSTVIWVRPRGLHIQQGGIFNEPMSASLFDVARIAFALDPAELKHSLCFYIPKSESAEEALWWSDLFQAIAAARGWKSDHIKCMALVESHPLAYQMEEFLYNLRGHILGLNLGRWDYMASLIDFNLTDPQWVLPDRNTIPHDVPFFQNLRELMPEVCHKRGVLAIGGMTALYPSRTDAELNERALAVLKKDKKNEADCGMDGAWTGHPDQNQIAIDQFPSPNQLQARKPQGERYPNLRPPLDGVGKKTVEGTCAAVRTVIRYRNGVLNGRGASLLDGYMEDLATDRIYRLMIVQRMRHGGIVDESGNVVPHTREFVSRTFDEELGRILSNSKYAAEGDERTFRRARQIAEEMVMREEFDPI